MGLPAENIIRLISMPKKKSQHSRVRPRTRRTMLSKKPVGGRATWSCRRKQNNPRSRLRVEEGLVRALLRGTRPVLKNIAQERGRCSQVTARAPPSGFDGGVVFCVLITTPLATGQKTDEQQQTTCNSTAPQKKALPLPSKKQNKQKRGGTKGCRPRISIPAQRRRVRRAKGQRPTAEQQSTRMCQRLFALVQDGIHGRPSNRVYMARVGVTGVPAGLSPSPFECQRQGGPS